MQRITELLKPGGLFISITPCLGEKMMLSTKIKFSLLFLISKLGLIPSVKRFKFYELEDLIAVNLQIVEIKNWYHLISFNFIVAKKT